MAQLDWSQLHVKPVAKQLPFQLDMCWTSLDLFQSDWTRNGKNEKPVSVQLKLKKVEKLDWTGLWNTNTITQNNQTQHIAGFNRSYNWSTLRQGNWLTNVCGTQYTAQFGLRRSTPQSIYYDIRSGALDCHQTRIKVPKRITWQRNYFYPRCRSRSGDLRWLWLC